MSHSRSIGSVDQITTNGHRAKTQLKEFWPQISIA